MLKIFESMKKVIIIGIFIIVFSCQTVEYKDGVPLKEETLNERLELLIFALESPRPQIGKISQEIIEEHSIKAVYKLKEKINDRNAIIRTISIYCLGQIYERTKSSEILKIIPAIKNRLTDRNQRVRLEAAGTLCILKVYDGVPLLISALRNESPYVRMTAIETLFLTFKQRFGYEHNDNAKKRNTAADKWEKWWMKNKEKYLKI